MSTSPRSRSRSPHRAAGAERLVLCLNAAEYRASLEPRKIYVVLPDTDAEAHGQLRVVDESGEDYLFPAELFAPIEVSASVRRALLGS